MKDSWKMALAEVAAVLTLIVAVALVMEAGGISAAL